MHPLRIKIGLHFHQSRELWDRIILLSFPNVSWGISVDIRFLKFSRLYQSSPLDQPYNGNRTTVLLGHLRTYQIWSLRLLDWGHRRWMKARSCLWSSWVLFYLIVLAGRAWQRLVNGSHWIPWHLLQSSCWSYYEGMIFGSHLGHNQWLETIFHLNDACILHQVPRGLVLHWQSYTPKI